MKGAEGPPRQGSAGEADRKTVLNELGVVLTGHSIAEAFGRVRTALTGGIPEGLTHFALKL